MSLTSYRAAPPRAKRIRLCRMSRLRHRFAMTDCAGAKPLGFVSCKGRTGYRMVSSLGISIALLFALERRKAAFGAALEFGQGP